MIDAGLPTPLTELIEQFSKLPGVGRKTATRYALFLIRAKPATISGLAETIATLPERIFECSRCRNYADSTLCRFCSDHTRNDRKLCVVEDPLDLLALEQSGGFDGRYFVLHGVLSPIDGIGAAELRLGDLRALVAQHPVEEVIVATNASMEGDATASEIARLLSESGCTVTRLARGLATGGDIEFVDAQTLSLALSGRRQL